ncbi:transmembrane protein 104-like [Coregonus clupeaformis]|uniref:transmembrane protein 104-like n=1 Tax=Coregonus clupeaformis TaxID=59861 RepID=UPI001E1C4D65|nr:transmembrane protein 104-like [Coregonus clupeaformis]
MAGGITETGELFCVFAVGLVYMFNLIVGTGALTMPKAFAQAGWAVSLVLISFLGFISYMTTTFVIEAMAAANAQLRWKREGAGRGELADIKNQQEEEQHSTSDYSDDDVLVRGRSEPETRPILSVQRTGGHVDHFDIVERVEMGQMASMFFNKVGVNMFYICMVVYLHGDLAIHAAAVPISLMEVAWPLEDPWCTTPLSVSSPCHVTESQCANPSLRGSGQPQSRESPPRSAPPTPPLTPRSPEQLLSIHRSVLPNGITSPCPLGMPSDTPPPPPPKTKVPPSGP